MKKVLSLLVVCLVIFLTPVMAFAAQESEDNNDISKADLISVNTNVSGVIDGYTDKDWYKFKLSSDGYIKIDAAHQYGVLYSDYELYYYDGSSAVRLNRFFIPSNAERKSSCKLGLPAGMYYLKVYSDLHNSNVKCSYAFAVNFTSSSAWETEPNNTIVKADTKYVNSQIYGAIDDSDVDWYKFSLSKAGSVNISYTHDYGSFNNDITVYTYNGSSQKQKFSFFISENAEKASSGNYSLAAGTYYICVKKGDYVSTSDICHYNFKINYTQQTTTTTKKTTTTTRNYVTNPPATTTKNYYSNPTTTTRNYNTTTYNYQPTQSNQPVVYSYNEYNYYTISSTEVYICGYMGTADYITIPETIYNYKVVGITDNAFQNVSYMVIEIPSCIRYFGENALGQVEHPLITVACDPGSAAQNYAAHNLVDYSNIETAREDWTRDDSETAEGNDYTPSAPTSSSNNDDNGGLITVLLVGAIFFAAIFLIVKRKK